MAKSYEQIIEDIKANYEYFQKEADKYKKLLLVAGSTMPSAINEDVLKKPIVDNPIEVPDSKKKQTFEEQIVDILSDGVPRTSRVLQDHYEKKFGAVYETKNFSSKLSIASKAKGTFRNLLVEGFPKDLRYWWCLSSWFKNDHLLNEYMAKIKK